MAWLNPQKSVWAIVPEQSVKADRGKGPAVAGNTARKESDVLKAVARRRMSARGSPGKDFLMVFDFVDNTNMFNVVCSIHRILGLSEYVQGGLVLGPKHGIKMDQDMFRQGQKPEVLVDYKQKEGEHMERAEALFQRFQILAILDWLENESSSSSSSGDHTGLGDHTLVDGVGNGEPGDRQCAENDAQKNSRMESRCYTLEQFIDATRPGRLDCWDDEVVLRFVEGVEVTESGVSVRFKSGVTVVVE